MKEIAELLNLMRASGVIKDYALFGAIAQMRYTEAVATLDFDVLIAVPAPERLDVLRPIYDFCRKSGYAPKGEAIQVGAWPVQFIPIHGALLKDALEKAEAADFEGASFRVVKADYLAVIALSVGRKKDFARILALLDTKHVTREKIGKLAEKYGFNEAWQRFQQRFLNE